MLVSQVVRQTVAPVIFGDQFNRAGQLAGSSLDYGSAVWSLITGNGATTYSSGGGYVSGSGTAVSIHGFDVKRGSYRIRVTQPSTSNLGGDCIYFRVKDASNWWRLRENGNQVTTPGGSYQVTEWREVWVVQYRFEAPPGCHSGHSHTGYAYSAWVLEGSSPPRPATPGTVAHQHNTCVFHYHGVENMYPSHPEYRMRTETYPPSSSPMHQLVLEKRVNGTVSQVALFTNLGSTPPPSWGVNVTPSQVQVVQGTAVKGSYNDSTLSGEFIVGVGRGPSSAYTQSRINSFKVT